MIWMVLPCRLTQHKGVMYCHSIYVYVRMYIYTYVHIRIITVRPMSVLQLCRYMQILGLFASRESERERERERESERARAVGALVGASVETPRVCVKAQPKRHCRNPALGLSTHIAASTIASRGSGLDRCGCSPGFGGLFWRSVLRIWAI